MLKFLLIILLIVGVYFFIRKIGSKSTQETHSKKTNHEEIMLECKKCGTYISSKEAIISNGEYYCSKECLERS